METSYLILAGALVALALIATYGIRAYVRAAKGDAVSNPGEGIPDPKASVPKASVPKASVIVYSQSDDQTLGGMLEALLAQDYPDFEVIVVADCAAEHARMLAERFEAESPRVYVTYIQPGSHNLSRRKLAITIGVKAARGEVIVTTAANAEIPSTRWLSLLMDPFVQAATAPVDVSLGVTRMDFGELRGPGKWYRQFDALLTNALWIGYAAWGLPYRGDGYNLAFRRQTFFDHKGYARTINLHCGDDDLFIHEIADGANTRVVTDSDSILTMHWGASANRLWALRKSQYSFTSRWLPKPPFIRSGVMMGLQWILPLLCGLGAWTGWHTVIAPVAAALILLAGGGMEIYWYRRLAAAYGAVRLWWAVIPFWLWRPLGDLVFKFDHRASRKKNFTWQR